jgi:hypothetical protein
MNDEALQTKWDEFSIRRYGEVQTEYFGEGVVTNKGRAANCRFSAGQLRDGGVLLLCDFHLENPINALGFTFLGSVEAFEGTSEDGWRISTNGKLTQRNWILPSPPRDSYMLAAFYVDHLIAQKPRDEGSVDVVFELTNFSYTKPFDCTVCHNDSQANIRISPVKDVRDRLSRLQTIRGIDVMAEASIAWEGSGRRIEIVETIDDFCHLASIALGTQVQWVSLRFFDSSESVEHVEHRNCFNKPFGGLEIIDRRSRLPDELPQFIVDSYSKFRMLKNSWEIHRVPLLTYLDAKSEGDFLETRAVKLSIALETLKSAFLSCGETDVSEFILDQSEFKSAILPPLRDACQGVLVGTCDQVDIEALVGDQNLMGLNRRSFRSIVKKLLAHIGLKVSPAEIQKFVASRNSLVHSGCFTSSKPVDEWLFMINFLDRIYLKLLGYSGPYINWAKPEPDRRDILE